MTVRELLRRARAEGWTVEKTRRHYRLRHPKAARFVVVPGTPSCS
jgi:predicted RNA binding protein YcfA (HicA-like mRNA interferase family)